MSTAAAWASAFSSATIPRSVFEIAVLRLVPVRLPAAWFSADVSPAYCCAMKVVILTSCCCSAEMFCSLATFTEKAEIPAATIAASAETKAIQVAMWLFRFFFVFFGAGCWASASFVASVMILGWDSRRQGSSVFLSYPGLSDM